MAGQGTGRVDPRELLRSLGNGKTEWAVKATAGAAVRASVLALCAAVGLASFGTLVVRANDDSGALAFIRSQTKPRAAAADFAPRGASPVSYYAPRAFFQAAAPRAERPAPGRQQAAQPQRAGTIVAAYAPFGGFMPFDASMPVHSNVRVKTQSAARPAVSAPQVRAVSGGRGGLTYCVRTCDGFFFPLGPTSGSDRTDEAACNRMCPTSETKLYNGQVGADIDDARSRQTGRRYAAMTNAFAYRTSFDKSCTCNAGGVGLTNAVSVSRDPTLKVGDIVMTAKGMRVFIGGQLPYRDANFTTIDRSGRFAGAPGEALRSIERASMPGRSGVPRQAAAPRRTDEVSDLRRAAAALQSPSQVVRYVGPDRTSQVR